MRGLSWTILVETAFTASGCGNRSADGDDISTRESEKWRDLNFEILPIGTYTDYAIADLYLMSPTANDIDVAAEGSVPNPTRRGATDWESGSSGPAVAWDRRWKSPRRFKVWWQRVFDSNLYSKSGQYPKDGNTFDPYDPYTTRQTRPGSAWCEGEVEVKEHFGDPYGPPFPNMTRRELVLYFYPDGTVQGSLEFSGYQDIRLIDINKRDELPVLHGRACLKEIANPLYGKPKPRSIS